MSRSVVSKYIKYNRNKSNAIEHNKSNTIETYQIQSLHNNTGIVVMIVSGRSAICVPTIQTPLESF